MIPQETIELINQKATDLYPISNLKPDRMEIGKHAGYIAGATEWAGKAQEKDEWYEKRIKSLRDTLEQILHAPVPANEREYMAWFVAAKNVAGGAISDDDAEIEVAKYKEVGSVAVKEIEYMPVHPEDVRKPDCPKQFPMHLLNEGQAYSNHGQTLKRLKERGGLGVTEILAIIHQKKWAYYGNMKWEEVLKMLNDILNKEVTNG